MGAMGGGVGIRGPKGMEMPRHPGGRSRRGGVEGDPASGGWLRAQSKFCATRRAPCRTQLLAHMVDRRAGTCKVSLWLTPRHECAHETCGGEGIAR